MKKKTKDSIQKDEFEMILNPKLPPLWTDYFEPSVREDGIVLLRLATLLPEGVFEHARIISNEKTMKEFTSYLCSVLDYYPKKSDDDTSV